ncbi:MAG: TonB-dependent receptor [Chitinophagaceae bacterium]|nr:TonB-dependent receptor [Chitinophagaceae bacterium]
MKKFWGTMSMAFFYLLATGQPNKHSLSGLVTDQQTHQPLAAATITLGNRQLVTDETGQFRFDQNRPGTYLLTVSLLGYRDFQQQIKLQRNESLSIALQATSLFLEPLEIKAIRATSRAPFAKTNISKTELAKMNQGQDIPFLLNQSPSVVINSDAGNGVGYTGIRIRGTDATRINVTLNGIPYNDAESLGTFFVDLPDFASSVNSIQIQRGVGTSSNGAGAFGATINLSTNEFREKAYTEINNSFGSFHTWKNTIKAGTGLIGNHFTFDGRFSNITSNGYIDRATSDLKSFYTSAAWISKKSALRLNIFSGKERTYQAWYGVAESLLNSKRTDNPAGTEKPGTPYNNQVDHYRQTHYQLFFNQQLQQHWSLQVASFLTRGKGYYEEYKADQRFSRYGLPNAVVGGTTYTRTDLVRQRWLDNYYYGQTLSLQYRNQADELTLGGGWTTYDGKHYGTLPWLQYGNVSPTYRYYDLPARKQDANLYIKWQHRLNNRWSLFQDLQYRYVRHRMDGFQANPALWVNRHFNFINPKLGISYAFNGVNAYLSYALAHKEPNRDDFEAGASNQPKPETLHDLELGLEQRTNRFFYAANLYYMYYVNQLVLTGQINDVGAYTRFNVPYSYRLGLELQGGYTINHWLQAQANLTISRNKIRSFTEYVDNYDTGNQDAVARKNTDISFSPNIIGGATVTVTPASNWEISLLHKMVGRQYLDNSQLKNRSLKPFNTQDIRVIYGFKHGWLKQAQVIAQVNNIFNHLYEPNGYTYSYVSSGTLYTDNGYYPMAGTNFMLSLNMRF